MTNEIEPSAAMNEDVVEPEVRKSTAEERRDGAERVARHRAKKQLELATLTEKKIAKLKATVEGELAAQAAEAEAAMRSLTPQQREIMRSDVFQHGLPDGSSAGFRYLRAYMFDIVLTVELGLFEVFRADWEMEFYEDFVVTFPFAKSLVMPRAWYHGSDFNHPEYILDSIYGLRDATGRLVADFDPDWPTEYTVQQFLDAVAKWRVHSSRVPATAAVIDTEPEPLRRPRMRRLPPKPKPVVDSASESSFSTPPNKPQQEYWSDVARGRTQIAVKKDIEEAGPPLPVVFPQ
jgi:hypothetical protein